MAKRSLDATSFGYVAKLRLPIVRRRTGESCFRIHRTLHDPFWFGPGRANQASGRFDAPAHEYGACYFGMSLDVAFAETLLRNPSSRLLSGADLAARSISIGHLTRSIRLVQLHGAGLNRLRISTDTVHGPHDACRRLALELWKHPAQVDGIAYRSRFDNDEICISLFNRAADAVVIDTTDALLVNIRQLSRLLDKYDVGLDP